MLKAGVFTNNKLRMKRLLMHVANHQSTFCNKQNGAKIDYISINI